MIDINLNKYCTGCSKFMPKLSTIYMGVNGETLKVNHTVSCEYKDECDIIRTALSINPKGRFLESIPDGNAIELYVKPYCEDCPSFVPDEYKMKIRETGKYGIYCKHSQNCRQIKEHLLSYCKKEESKEKEIN